jgi:hypothetical protein
MLVSRPQNADTPRRLIKKIVALYDERQSADMSGKAYTTISTGAVTSEKATKSGNLPVYHPSCRYTLINELIDPLYINCEEILDE